MFVLFLEGFSTAFRLEDRANQSILNISSMDYSNGSGDRCAWDSFSPPNEGKDYYLVYTRVYAAKKG